MAVDPEDVVIRRDRLAQALGQGFRSYLMSQFVPGAKEADVEYECTTEGHDSVVRFMIKGVNSKLFKTVAVELRMEHSS
jgi:hypothetical protein